MFIAGVNETEKPGELRLYKYPFYNDKDKLPDPLDPFTG